MLNDQQHQQKKIVTVDELAQYIFGPEVNSEVEKLEPTLEVAECRSDTFVADFVAAIKYKEFSAYVKFDKFSGSFLIGTLTINLYAVLLILQLYW